MGTIFEERIRKFNEAQNENPGEHFTPRDVVHLMVDLMLAGDEAEIRARKAIRTVYDPCCGSGGMLMIAKEHIAVGVRMAGGLLRPAINERDGLDNDDKFMRHLAQVVCNALGDRAGTCIDPKTQIVAGKTVCVVACQRSPEPVFLRWQGTEAVPEGDFFVRSGPGTVKLPPDSAQEYIRTRFGDKATTSDASPQEAG